MARFKSYKSYLRYGLHKYDKNGFPTIDAFLSIFRELKTIGLGCEMDWNYYASPLSRTYHFSLSINILIFNILLKLSFYNYESKI